MGLWSQILSALTGSVPSSPERQPFRRWNVHNRRKGHKRSTAPKTFRNRHVQNFAKGLTTNRFFTKNRKQGSGFWAKINKPIIAFHGTPSSTNAKSILKDGWMVGSGNAFGDGIYFATDTSTAKQYAGSSGVYLKCRIQLGRSCSWNEEKKREYADWCRRKGVNQDNSAMTAFLIQTGFNSVRHNNIIVMLAPQYSNPTAWKRKQYKIRILSIHRASDDQKISV